jgi:TRAP-type C4-dicarboxylate transport system permease small subunit
MTNDPEDNLAEPATSTWAHLNRPRPTWVRTIDGLAWILAAVASVLLLVLTINILADAGSRSFFNRPLPLTLEISSHYWMPIIVFFGLAAAQRHDEHLRVTLLLDGLSARARRIAELAAYVISTALVMFILYFVVDGAIQSTVMNETDINAGGLPLWPARWSGAIGWLALGLQLIATLYRLAVDRPLDFLQRPEPVSEIIEREL